MLIHVPYHAPRISATYESPELAEAMGVAVELLPPVDSVSQTATRKMLGNGMHVYCIGALLMAARIHVALDGPSRVT